MLTKIKIAISSLWIISILIISCESDISLKGKPVNFHGGYQRNNSYEEYGNFKRQLYYLDSYDSIHVGGAIAPLLILSSKIVVFPSSEGKVVVIKDREIKSIFTLDEGSVTSAAMAADPEQNIYIIDNKGKLYSFSLTGGRNWAKNIYEIEEDELISFSDLLALNDGIVTASSKGKIVKLSYSGKILWSKSFNMHIPKNFCANDSGYIALPLTHNIFGMRDTLVFLSPEGKITWSKSFSKFRLIKASVIQDNHIFFVGIEGKGENKKSYVICCDDNGKTIWKKKFDLMPRSISVDNNKTAYIIAYSGGFGLGKPISMISALDSNGKVIWDKFIEVTLPCPILISEDVLAFAGTDDLASGIYFMRKNGAIENVISLSDAPPFLAYAAVTPNKNILFGTLDKTQIIRIDETPMKKIVPW
jgi:hypothetical protein